MTETLKTSKHRDASWQPASLFSEVPSFVEASVWLCYAGSLTKALERSTKGQAQWRVSCESYESPQAEEQTALSLSPSTIGYIREGGWYHRESLWVVTRTVIPLVTGVEPTAFKNLGEKPIGKILFASDKTVRHPFEFKPIPPAHPGYAHLFPDLSPEYLGSIIWARRSLFSFEGAFLLICEIFSPALLKQPFIAS